MPPDSISVAKLKNCDKISMERGVFMQLKFNPDGKFRIMQIADIQDTQITSRDTVEFIAAASPIWRSLRAIR